MTLGLKLKYLNFCLKFQRNSKCPCKSNTTMKSRKNLSEDDDGYDELLL